MVLNNLRKSVKYYRQQLSSITDINQRQFELLKGLPFYSDWISSKRADLDFNHAIGLPQKNGQPMPLFEYEQMLFYALQSNKHIWIKKATGLGVTEFMLRYMAWLCFNNAHLVGSQMCIVTGPRIELAITLIDRLKGLFTNGNVNTLQFTTKETSHRT